MATLSKTDIMDEITEITEILSALKDLTEMYTDRAESVTDANKMNRVYMILSTITSRMEQLKF